MPDKHLSFDGTNGNKAESPSTAPLNLSNTDFILRLDFIPDESLTPNDVIFAKDDVSGNGRSWAWQIDSTDLDYSSLWVFDDAGNPITQYAGGSVSLIEDLVHGVRAVYELHVDIDDGGGNSVVKWYVDDVLQETITIATPLTGANVINPDGTATLSIMGDTRAGDGTDIPGNLYRATIWSDLTKTTKIFDADFTDESIYAADKTTLVEKSSNAATVTLTGDSWAFVDPVDTFVVGPFHFSNF